MKPWLVGRNVPGGCKELCVCCVAGDTKDDAQAAFEAIVCGDREEYCSLVYDKPEESVKDKDGNEYAVVLLPLYRLEEAKLIRKQTEVRCDEPGCNWSLSVEPESVLGWHNVRCPKCRRGVIINDNEAEVFRQILAASEPDTGESGLLEIAVDTAMLREAPECTVFAPKT